MKKWQKPFTKSFNYNNTLYKMEELLQYIDVSSYKPGKKLIDCINWIIASRFFKDMEFVKNTLDTYPWIVDKLTINPNLTVDLVDHLLNRGVKVESGMYGLSCNPAMLVMIDSNPDYKGWHWGVGGISSNIGLTKEFVDKYADRLDFGPMGVSAMPCVTPEMVLKYYDKNWEFHKKFGVAFDDPRDDEKK